MEEKYECICKHCSKPFETSDENAIYCGKCWAEFLKQHFDGEGKGNS